MDLLVAEFEQSVVFRTEEKHIWRHIDRELGFVSPNRWSAARVRVARHRLIRTGMLLQVTQMIPGQ
jgi:hypothetical protein